MRTNKQNDDSVREVIIEEGVRDKSDEDDENTDGEEEEDDDDEKMDKLNDNDKLGMIKTIPEQF